MAEVEGDGGLMIPTEWTDVASSNVSAIKWQDGDLHVRYRHGGEYVFKDVDATEAESALHASSVGKALDALSKGRTIVRAK